MRVDIDYQIFLGLDGPILEEWYLFIKNLQRNFITLDMDENFLVKRSCRWRLNCQVRNQDTQLAFWMIQKWLPGGGSLFGCSEVDPQVANLVVEACLEAQRSCKI